jgi:telomere length regulation protein
VLEQIFDGLLLHTGFSDEKVSLLLDTMLQSEQKRIILGTLRILSTRYLNDLGNCEAPTANRAIGAAVRVIERLVNNSDGRQASLVEWLTSYSGAGMGEAVGIRRAVFAVCGRNMELIARIFNDSLSQFGDELYIKHAPSLQQDGMYPIEHHLKHLLESDMQYS